VSIESIACPNRKETRDGRGQRTV